MSQPRVDIYTAIHKALRFSMYETGALLERTNFADAAEKAKALASAERTLGFFDEHLALEDEYIVAHVKDAADPELAVELGEQHTDHAELSEAMQELFAELKEADGEEAVGLGFELCKLFNILVGDQSHHMNIEERDANTALWEALSDEQLVALRSKIQAAIPPPRFAEWLQIMIPNLNHQELVGTLRGMKASAPPEAFTRVSGMAKQLLGDRWPSIAAEVGI